MPKQIKEEFTKEQIDFAVEFARSLNGYNSLFNPYLANQYLKDINMRPVYKDREAVRNMVYNPRDNEQGLRRLSQHLYNTQTPYKRLIHYFADMLTFDLSIYPINASDKEMKTSKFKKDYEEVWKWLDKFNIKREFSKILLGMILEDGKFVYQRESDTGLTFQEMPSDYCIVDSWSHLGYLYSFNLLYFQQPGVDINSFPKEFKKYYRDVLDMQNNKTYYPNIKPEMRNGQWFYWQQINPEKGWIFKFDNTFAGLIPPFLGLFMDAIEIDTYKKLQQNKTKLEAYKMVFGTIPRNKDNKTGNKADDFAVNPTTLGNFMNLVKSSLPEGIDFKALPLENIIGIDFPQSETKNNIVGMAMKNFYGQSGVDGALFNADKPNSSTMKASTRIDAAFVEMVYSQFETFLNYIVNKKTDKFKFQFKLKGTIYDSQERFDNAMTKIQSGIITPDLPGDLGMTEKQMRSGMNFMKAMGYQDLFTPIQTAYTLSGKDKKNGKPESDDSDLDVAGEITRDAGSNEE